MRRLLFGLAILAGASAVPSISHAQTGVDAFNDPFLAYYGFFLPRQAALSNQPGPEMSINELSAARQVDAITERAGLYEPPVGLGGQPYDPRHPFANGSGVSRRPYGRTGVSNVNISGSGPGDYYNRAQSYYPGLRVGRGPNANVAVTRSGSRGRGAGMVRGGMSPGAGLPRGVSLNRR